MGIRPACDEPNDARPIPSPFPVGELEQDGRKRIICGARYVRLDDPAVAEIALTVHDEFQRLGIGEVMLRQLARQAQADGIRRLVADILPSNDAMLGLLRKVLSNHRRILSAGVYHAECDLSCGVGDERSP